jgi:hypothetical protein
VALKYIPARKIPQLWFGESLGGWLFERLLFYVRSPLTYCLGSNMLALGYDEGTVLIKVIDHRCSL